MTHGSATGSPFENWQSLQRELHSLERQLAQAAREQASGTGPGVLDELVQRVQLLRLEVDALFPAAMKELEEQVRTLHARRPTLGDL